MPATRPDSKPPLCFKHHQGFRLGFIGNANSEHLDQLVEFLRQPTVAETDPLNGRVLAKVVELPDWGSVVIKAYVRGGWMRYISHRRHVRSRESRAQKEFQLLQMLHDEGFPVPQPLAWAERGTLLVHKWLILSEVPEAQTLAQLARDNPDRAYDLLPRVRQLIQELIDRGVHHVDLHPGNVLIDAENDVHLIDFDKGAEVAYTQSDLRQRYHRRWNRAVAKHNLPDKLQFSPRELHAPASEDPQRMPSGLQCLPFFAEWEPLLAALPF
jgi:tRNA A-37 threonylcarbamoyl transferase component Bud32